jgi:amphi-Trp domain-containing protein
MTENFNKEFRLSYDTAAEFLRDVADAIEDEDQLNLEGDDWKVSQPLSDKVPMRLFGDEEGLEIGFKLLK